MSLDQDLVRLVREVVKAELNNSRSDATEVVGRGGDTVISSIRNIYLRPGANGKAYYGDTEIGSGGGGGGGAVTSVFGRIGAVVAVNTDYSAYYLLLTGGTLTGDSSITNKKAWQFYDSTPSLNGKIYADLDVETARHFYLWASATTYIDLQPATGILALYANSDIHLIPGGASAINVHSSKIISLAAGTEAGNAVRYEQVLLLAGGTMSGAIAMGTNKITGLGNPTVNQDAATKYYVDNNPVANADTLDTYHASAFALLAANNIFTGNKQYLLGAGGSEANYPQWLMKNTTYGAAYYSVLRLNDAGKLELKSAEGSILLMGTLAMGANKITGLAAGTTNGDALRYEQLVGQYLLLTGGTMTGAIAHGAYNASFADGYGIDFRNDNVHKINYTLASNTLDFSTYQRFDFLTTVDSSVDFSILYDSIICHEPLYFRHAHVADNCYIVDDTSGTMELHVPTGQKLKVIIG
jgi:hypothetical protein